jgi:hypothetical protein
MIMEPFYVDDKPRLGRPRVSTAIIGAIIAYMT